MDQEYQSAYKKPLDIKLVLRLMKRSRNVAILEAYPEQIASAVLGDDALMTEYLSEFVSFNIKRWKGMLQDVSGALNAFDLLERSLEIGGEVVMKHIAFEACCIAAEGIDKQFGQASLKQYFARLKSEVAFDDNVPFDKIPQSVRVGIPSHVLTHFLGNYHQIRLAMNHYEGPHTLRIGRRIQSWIFKHCQWFDEYDSAEHEAEVYMHCRSNCYYPRLIRVFLLNAVYFHLRACLRGEAQ